MEVEVEDGYDEPIVWPITEADLGKSFVMVYTETIQRWLPPHEDEPITLEKKKKIVQNIDVKLSKAGIRHRME
jgi:hypothetical protein